MAASITLGRFRCLPAEAGSHRVGVSHRVSWMSRITPSGFDRSPDEHLWDLRPCDSLAFSASRILACAVGGHRCSADQHGRDQRRGSRQLRWRAARRDRNRHPCRHRHRRRTGHRRRGPLLPAGAAHRHLGHRRTSRRLVAAERTRIVLEVGRALHARLLAGRARPDRTGRGAAHYCRSCRSRPRKSATSSRTARSCNCRSTAATSWRSRS